MLVFTSPICRQQNTCMDVQCFCCNPILIVRKCCVIVENESGLIRLFIQGAQINCVKHWVNASISQSGYSPVQGLCVAIANEATKEDFSLLLKEVAAYPAVALVVAPASIEVAREACLEAAHLGLTCLALTDEPAAVTWVKRRGLAVALSLKQQVQSHCLPEQTPSDDWHRWVSHQAVQLNRSQALRS